MADISSYLADIMAAVYGEDVRGSIHDAIEIINDVSEVVLTTGTAVTGPTSSSTGFYDDSLYLNTSTMELWKCVGTNLWQSQGVLKGDPGAAGVGISSIDLTSSVGLVDTYTITYTDGDTTTFTVTNGQDGTDGEDGNKWYRGTAISGKDPNPTVFSGSGITLANPNDFYLNPTEGAVYHCVTGGNASTATWSYDFTMTGGGGGGVTDYPDLTNLPEINGVTLLGDKSASDLNLMPKTTLATIATSGNLADAIEDSTHKTVTATEKTTWNGKVSDNPTFTEASTRTNIASGESFATIFGKIKKYFADLKTVAFSGSYSDLSDKPTIPTVNNGQLTIQQNGTTKSTFTANQSGNASANIVTGEFIKSASPSSGFVTFTGVDDSVNSGGCGYDVFFDITSSSTNKSPYAKLTSISGEGTSNCTLTYQTDADDGTNTAHLYQYK